MPFLPEVVGTDWPLASITMGNSESKMEPSGIKRRLGVREEHDEEANQPARALGKRRKAVVDSDSGEDGEEGHTARMSGKRRKLVIDSDSGEDEEEEVIVRMHGVLDSQRVLGSDSASQVVVDVEATIPFRSADKHLLHTGLGQDRAGASAVLKSELDHGTDQNGEVPDDLSPVLAKNRLGNGAYVVASPLQFPSSRFAGWEPPANLGDEGKGIILALPGIPEDESYVYLELNDFAIYQPSGKRLAYDLCSLDRLQTKSSDSLCFDGVLSVGEQAFGTGTRQKGKVYVRDVCFSTLTVDGYGDYDIVKGHISIQSKPAHRHGIWYRLGKPAAEYRRFYKPFLWLSTFTKFFVEYLLEHPKEPVTLNHFRSRFVKWARQQYGAQPEFKVWHNDCGNRIDFRTTVNAHISYLRKECFGVDEKNTLKHPVWGEVYSWELTAIRPQTNKYHNTVVTPFVYAMFKRMYFSAHLDMCTPSAEIAQTVKARKREKCLTPADPRPTPRPVTTALDPHDHLNIVPQDVVILAPDADSAWKKSGTQWFAYVQDVHTDKEGDTLLDILWLYETSDTTLGNSYYPFKNELFLSDNCSCGKDAVSAATVLGKIDVRWFVTDPNSIEVNEFFVRQKFQTVAEEDKHDFVTLRATDFKCKCKEHVTASEECHRSYRLGDTVLVRPGFSEEDDVLEPARIVELSRSKRMVRVQMFNSTGRAPNELAESEEFRSVWPQFIIRKCHVGCFSTRADVCAPYDRGGAGDFFYVLGNASQSSAYAPSSLHAQPGNGQKPRLTGLGMFCGGGNFDRGLEDGGAVKFKYAIDWAEHALHSYRANVEEPQDVRFFLGSVNDYLAKAMRGSPSSKIARVGDVDLISGGSPCPGFSNLQPDKQSESSLQFASMVASVVAFVDVYSPDYFILENVVTMTNMMGVNKDQNVFAQILAALVALGYQAQQFLVDAWTQGSSQSRSRVFIVASAPGLKPFEALPHTHGHPTDRLFVQRSLGKASNGLRFGVRRNDFTAFNCISAREATADLPDIGDSMPQICPRFPDHRTPAEERYATRQRIARIPTRPHGMGIAKAVSEGHIKSGEAYEFWAASKSAIIRGSKESKSYMRVRPGGLFPTVITNLSIQCGKAGVGLHWEQQRTLSVQEARRAQGFLDEEVIVGTPQQQWKIIGNSVDRNVSFALGLALRQSWLCEANDGHSDTGDEIQVASSREVDNGQSEAGDEIQVANGIHREQSAVTGSTDPLSKPWPATLRGTGGPQPTENQLASIRRESDHVKKQGFKVIRRLLDSGNNGSGGASLAATPMRDTSETMEVNGLLTPTYRKK